MPEMTLGEAIRIAEVIDGVRRGARVFIAVEGDFDRTLEGVLRHFAPSKGSGMHACQSDRVQELWVRVSGTFEHWFSLDELTLGLAQGTVTIER